mmetsp:Transcript_3646/g.10302  ORF Transcript_3646/g.10302 Transcript_3646/m.10302 type:complete len:233 (-) Transcript_3646:452-1150(-)
MPRKPLSCKTTIRSELRSLATRSSSLGYNAKECLVSKDCTIDEAGTECACVESSHDRLVDFLNNVLAPFRKRPRLIFPGLVELFPDLSLSAWADAIRAAVAVSVGGITGSGLTEWDRSLDFDRLRSLDLDWLRSCSYFVGSTTIEESSGMLPACRDTSLLGRRPGGSNESADSLSPVLLVKSSRVPMLLWVAPCERAVPPQLGSSCISSCHADACFFCWRRSVWRSGEESSM